MGYKSMRRIDMNKKDLIRQRIGFGAADMASNFVWPMITTYLAVFYTDVAGIDAIAVGMIMLLSKFIDACTDVLMGIVVDMTRTKWGKCRPYFLFGAIPLACFAVLTFFIPDFGNVTNTIVYAFVTFNLVSTGYTIVNTPLSAILPSLTDDKQERNILVTFRMVMAAIGSFCVTTFATPLINHFGGNQNPYSYAWTIGAFSVIAVVLFFFAFANTKESVKSMQAEKVTVRQGIKAINGQYILFIFIMFVFMLGFAIKQAGVVYYYTYVVENVSIIPIQAAVTSIAMIAGQTCIPMFTKKLSKTACMCVMCIISFVGNMFFVCSGNNTTMLIIGTAIVWYGLGFLMGMRFSVLADVVDYCEMKSGIHAAGILSSFDSFVAKLTFGLNVTLFTFLMKIGGYIPNQKQTDVAKMYINIGFIGIPVACLVLTVILLKFFKVEKLINQKTEEEMQDEEEELAS